MIFISKIPVKMLRQKTPYYEIWLLLHFYYTTKAHIAIGFRLAADNLTVEQGVNKETPFL
jgi:hypothetical protein